MPAESISFKSDANTSTSRRRRPRKIKDSAVPDLPDAKSKSDGILKSEILGLKCRVEEIESRMQQIQLQRERKLPRRRTGKKKNADPADEEPSEHIEVDDETMVLEERLEIAKRELAESKLKLNMTTGQTKKALATEEDVEEIPRATDSNKRVDIHRAVTIAGSYRFPVPEHVSDGDLDAVRNGLRGFQNIARGYVDETEQSRRDFQPTSSGTGWSSWIGGYSMSVARFVNNIRLSPPEEPLVEQGSLERPLIKERSRSEPVARKKPRKLRLRKEREDGAAIKDLKAGAAGLLS